MKFLCFAVLLTAVLSHCNAEDCRQLSSCVSCTEGELSLNFSCKWMTCGDSENSSCVTSEELLHESCIASNSSSMCAGNIASNSSSLCAGPENRSAEPAEMPSEDSPEAKTFSPPVFHVGSFIGGGVLVILLQTIGYFVLKHLRGPESDYQTMRLRCRRTIFRRGKPNKGFKRGISISTPILIPTPEYRMTPARTREETPQ